MEIKTFTFKTKKRNETSRLLFNAITKTLVIQEYATLGRSLIEEERTVYNGNPEVKVVKNKWEESFDGGKTWDKYEDATIFVNGKEIISGDLLGKNRDKNTGILEVDLVTSWN
jgi:hypothetical protein